MLSLTCLTLLSPVFATSTQAQAFISPYAGANYGGNAQCPVADLTCVNHNTTYGIAFGNLNALIGFEQDISYSKRLLKNDPSANSSVLTAMSNVLVGPSFKHVRVYGAGGFGLIRVRKEFTAASLLAITDSNVGWNIGGGAMVTSRHIGVRFDIRAFHGLNDLAGFDLPLTDLQLDYKRVIVGLVVQ